MTHIHISHYNINIQSGLIKALVHVSACRLMFRPYNTLPFLKGVPLVIYKIFHTLNLSNLSYVSILNACICLYMWPSWNLVLWNCVRPGEIDCGAGVVTLFHW